MKYIHNKCLTLFIVYFIIIQFILHTSVICTQSSLVYYQSFDHQSNTSPTFESPSVSTEIAYKNTSAIIITNDSLFQRIIMYPNIIIRNKTIMQYYWNYNITQNYTIGVIGELQIDNTCCYERFGFILKYENEPYNPQINNFLINLSFSYPQIKNTWNNFSIDLYSLISIWGLQLQGINITLTKLCFYLFQINQTGYFAVDEVSIFYVNETNKGQIDILYYILLGVIIIILSFSFVVFINNKK